MTTTSSSSSPPPQGAAPTADVVDGAASWLDNVDVQPQYYSRGQPIPRGCAPLQPWSYDGSPGRLAQFAYPCRPCCPSMNDIVDPANRKGGEYYHALSDVNHYDHDGYTLPWWGSAQRCAANCEWWQGLPARDRPPFATQPPLDLARDYDYLNPFGARGAFPPNYTTAPLPGAPPCIGRASCGCARPVGAIPPPIASTRGAQCPSYLGYYGSNGGRGGAVAASGGALASEYAWWSHALVQAVRAQRGTGGIGGNEAEAVAALERLAHTHRQLATATGKPRLAGVLDELARRVAALAQAHARNDGAAYAAARTRLYEQGDLAAATQNVSRSLQDAWRRYVRALVDQVEVRDAREAVQVFDRAHERASQLFTS